jgi:hypothetical protein
MGNAPDTDIYTVAPDGTALANLTNGPNGDDMVEDAFPGWRPKP